MGERVTDLVVLAVGAVAVILAVLLFGLLPETPQPTRQFLVTFDERAAEAAPQDLALVEGQGGEAGFAVVDGNLSSIELTIAFTDDVAASDPDLLRIEVVDPTGTVRPPSVETANLLPLTRAGSTPPTYDPVERTLTIVVPVNDKPSTQVITAAAAKETPQQAGQRVAALLAGGGVGTWTVRAAITAGDCPAPELDPQRAATCQGSTPGGQDGGNPVRIVQFRSFHWSAAVVPV